jgi:hypothetical protein
MEPAAQLTDLVRSAGGQREVARLLGKPHRQVWGWLAGQHHVGPKNRALIDATWRRLPADERHTEALRQYTGRPPALRVLPSRRPLDAALYTEDNLSDAGEGYLVPLEDYGARHAAGALARSRPRKGRR